MAGEGEAGVLFLLVLSLLALSHAVEGSSTWKLSKGEDLEMERQLRRLNKQPALSHPLVRNHTIQMKLFTLSKGLGDESSSRKKPLKTILDGKCSPGTVVIRRTKKDDLIRAKKHVPSYHVSHTVLDDGNHDEVGMRIPEKEVADGCSASPDGPDTSSFTAFLYSFLSSSDSGGHSGELNESTGEIGEKASTSGIKEIVGRKSLLSRGKQSLGRAFHKAARLTGYRQNSEPKVDSNVTSDLKIVGHELRPMEVANETVAKFNLPESSEPSMLLSENMRSTLYVSLPALVQGRKWVLRYSTWRHGISLSTSYRQTQRGIFPSELVLEEHDTSGNIVFAIVILIVIAAVIGFIYYLYKKRQARIDDAIQRQMRQGLDPREIEMIGVSLYMEEGAEQLVDEGGEPEECTICLSELERGQPTSKLTCGHCFHSSCIKCWLRCRAVCPNCVRHIQGPSF